jgi:hypothetical protein
MGLFPLIGMFDSSFKGLRSVNRAFVVNDLLRSLVEELRSIPFYEPHTQANQGVNLDFDDRFWGERNPVWSNPAVGQPPAPDWESIPEVRFFGYGERRGFEDFRAGVKMSYVDESLDVASLKPGWGPKVPGFDRPVDVDNREVAAILFRVSVYWQAGGEEKKESDEGLLWSYKGSYPLGISSIEVLSPDSVKDPDKPNAASHYPNVPINVRVRGWGFRSEVGPNRASFSLVRSGYSDIPINITSLSENEMVGWLKLYDSSNVTDNPWKPRAPLGFWAIRVKQDVVAVSYLHNGFVVQYPRPILLDFGVGAGYRKEVSLGSAAWVYFRGKNFTWLGFDWGGTPQRCKVRLVSLDAEGNVMSKLEPLSIEAVSLPGGGYSDNECVIRAWFDFSQALLGDYFPVVANVDFSGVPGYVSVRFNGFSLRVAEGLPFALQSFQPIGNTLFWVNYYDIPALITGSGLSRLYSLKIRRGNVEYALSRGSEWNVVSDSQVSVLLNLIGCGAGTWTLVAESEGGQISTLDFAVTQGKPIVLPPAPVGSPTNLRIEYKKQFWLGSRFSEETTSTRAFALCGDMFLGVPIEAGYARFTVWGKGFPIDSGQSMVIRVFGPDLDRQGRAVVTWDRVNKRVRAVTPDGNWFLMPYERTGLYDLEVYLESSPSDRDTHYGRWELKKG